MKPQYYIIYIALLALCCCSYKSHSPSTEGETHWLKSCEHGSDCGKDGTCICGVCTTACNEQSDCADHDPNAICADSDSTALAEGCTGEDISLNTNLCVLPCEQNSDCTEDHTDLVCAQDLCVDKDHKLAQKTSAEETPQEGCPENPYFSCEGVEPSEVIGLSGYLDDKGCMLRTCSSDGDCLNGEICYRPAYVGACYSDGDLDCDDSSGSCECMTADRMDPCQDSFCLSPKPLAKCPDDFESEPMEDIDSYIDGDLLTAYVFHPGSCEDHKYSLCFSGNYDESDPVQPGIELIRDENGYDCGGVTDTGEEMVLYYDLTPLKEAYQQVYQSESGVMDTRFGLYTFGSLSCGERNRFAGQEIGRTVEDLNNPCKPYANCGVCNTDEDCIWVDNSISNCYYGCGSVISVYHQETFQLRLNSIEESICQADDDRECDPAIPPCIAPAPLSCVDGQCVEII